MKNRPVLLVVVANLAVLLLLATFASHLMISPGKPIEAHAEVATNCFACHTAFAGVSSAKCSVCHDVVEIGIKTTKGISIANEQKNVAFHQNLNEENCVACHSDHKGVQAFRPIGQFSHELLQQPLGTQCDSCHSLPGDALHLRVDSNCGACHTEKRWTPASFDHDDYFRFDRPHDSECASCHVDNIYDA